MGETLGSCDEEGEKQGKCPSQGAGALFGALELFLLQALSSLKNRAPWWRGSSSRWGNPGFLAANRFEVQYQLCWLQTKIFSQRNCDGRVLWEVPWAPLPLLPPFLRRGDLESPAVWFSSQGFVTPRTLHLEKLLSAGAEPFWGALCAPRQGHLGHLESCRFTRLDVLRLSVSSRHAVPVLATD